MDQVHLHLIITHLPIVGAILGVFVLGIGIVGKNDLTIRAAYYVLIISAIGAVISYITGEAAEEAVEHLQGVTHDIIERHEDFSKYTLISLSLTGLLSVAGLPLLVRQSHTAYKIAKIILVTALIGFGLAAWTGYLGGQIRHTEVREPGTEEH